jgi:hypothetical protein
MRQRSRDRSDLRLGLSPGESGYQQCLIIWIGLIEYETTGALARSLVIVAEPTSNGEAEQVLLTDGTRGAAVYLELDESDLGRLVTSVPSEEPLLPQQWANLARSSCPHSSCSETFGPLPTHDLLRCRRSVHRSRTTSTRARAARCFHSCQTWSRSPASPSVSDLQTALRAELAPLPHRRGFEGEALSKECELRCGLQATPSRPNSVAASQPTPVSVSPTFARGCV